MNSRFEWSLAACLCMALAIMPADRLYAELTGRVELEQFGVAFTVPDQWRGQLGDEAVILGGLQEPGLIILVQHEYSSLEDIEREARSGINDDGISLRLTGPLEPLGSDALAGRMAGTVSGHPAQVYVVARLNPLGDGVTIMAMTDEANYSTRYESLAREIAESLAFSEVKVAPVAQQASAQLMNTRLTFLESYSSGAAGGYSTRRSIDLCPDMRFQMHGSTSLGVDTGGAFGSAHGSGQGSGSWSVIVGAGGANLLELQHNNGARQQHVVSFEDGRTYLDGSRYFRIGANDPNGNGPRCH